MEEIRSNQKFIFLAIVSMFLPFYIGFAVLALLPFYLLYQQDLFGLIRRCKLSPFVLMFTGYSILVSFLFDNTYGVMASIAMLCFAVFMMFFYENVTKEMLRKAVPLTLVLATGNALVAILRYPYVMITRNLTVSETVSYWLRHRAASTFLNPNYYAMGCAFILLIAIYVFYVSTELKHVILSVVTTVTVGIAFFLAGSRGAMMAFAPMALLLMLLLAKKRKKFTIFMSVMAVIVLMAAWRMGLFYRFTYVNSDLDTRGLIWTRAWEAFRTNFLYGAGPLGFQAIFVSVNNQIREHAHNIFLDFLVNYGLIGAMLISPIVIQAVKSVRALRQQKVFPLLFAMTGYLFLHGMVDVTIFWHQNAFLYCSVLLPALAFAKQEQTEETYVLLKDESF